jgi:nicotinamide-nucleotide adenylyltransferase
MIEGTAHVAHVHGRFQPFHDEHLAYAEWAADGADALVVGITNADPAHVTPEAADTKRNDPAHNPFTYWERHEMVGRALDVRALDLPVRIEPFPISRPDLWDDYAPPDAVHYVNVLEEWHEVKADRLRAHDREVVTKRGTRTVSGSDIRRGMATGDAWREDVPAAVVDVVEAVDGVDRVASLYADRPGDER